MDTYIDRDIVALEDRLTTATQSIDVDALDALYAHDIIFTGVTGAVCDKPSIMDEARRGLAERRAAATTPGAAAGPGPAAVVSYDKDDLRAVRHGDTAIASFQFGVTIRSGAQEVTRRYRTTNVWMKRAGAWQVVAAHTALLG